MRKYAILTNSSILILRGGGVFAVSGVTHYVEFDFGTTFFGIPKEESRGFMNKSAVLLYYEINFLVTDFARVCFLPKLVGIRDLFHFLKVLVYFSY